MIYMYYRNNLSCCALFTFDSAFVKWAKTDLEKNLVAVQILRLPACVADGRAGVGQ